MSATVVRDAQVVELLKRAVECCFHSLTVLGHLPVAKPPAGKASLIPEELRALGIVSYNTLALIWYVEVSLKTASDAIGEAVCLPHDAVDDVLLDARGKIDYAATKLGKAMAGIEQSGKSLSSDEVRYTLVDKLTVDETIGSLRPGLRILEDAIPRIVVKGSTKNAVAPNASNPVTSIPVYFSYLSMDPGAWFEKEIEELKNQRQQLDEMSKKASQAADGAGNEGEPSKDGKAADPAGAAKAATGTASTPLASGKPTLTPEEAEEEKLEREEEAEERAEKQKAEAEKKRAVPEPAWYELDPADSPLYGQHALLLYSIGLKPVSNGYFLLFQGAEDKPEHVRTGQTNSAGRLIWDDTKQPAFLPAGQTYWCFWAYDAEEFRAAVEALTGPGAERGAFHRARKYGLFRFVTKLSRLVDLAGYRADPSIARTLAKQIFPGDGQAEFELGGRYATWASLRDRATYLFSGLLRDPQGYHAVGTGLEGGSTGDYEACWIVAQRPAISVVYMVEFLRLYIVDAKLHTAKHRATIQQMVGLVEESMEAALDRKRVPSFDLPAMRQMMHIGVNRQWEPAWVYDKRSLLTVRAEVRRHFGELVRYVRDCAMATSKDGRWIDPKLMEEALADEQETTIHLPGHEKAMRERIRTEFGPVFPQWIRHFYLWQYREHLLNYFAFYQYHRRVVEQNLREQTKDKDRWYQRWQQAARELERQSTDLQKLVKSLMDAYASTPAAWADIAWHEPAPPGKQTRSDEKPDFDNPKVRLHLRYAWASGEAKYAWWNSFPSPGTAEFEQEETELRKIAKATFDGLGRADEVLKAGIEFRHRHFTELVAGSLVEASVKAEGINRLIGGAAVPSGLAGGYLAAEMVNPTSNILKLSVFDGMNRRVGSMRFTLESLKLAKDQKGRDVILQSVGKKKIHLSQTAQMKKLAERNIDHLKAVPTFFSGVFNLAILAVGVKDFADSNKGQGAIFQLAGEVGYAAHSIVEVMEVVRWNRASLHLAEHVKPFTAGYTSFFGAVEIVQVFAEGAVCTFGEAPVAGWRGDVVRERALQTKGVILMVGSVIAAGATVAEIATAGLTAAAFGPAGWIIAGVVLLGVIVDGVAELFGETRTVITELEDKLYKAVKHELENAKLDGFHLSRGNTYLWRAHRVADTLLNNRSHLLPTTAFFRTLEPAAEPRAV